MGLGALAASCGTEVAALGSLLGGRGGLPLLLFLVGLTGSAVHCGPMCGPFVLAQVSDRLAAIPAARLCEASRLTSALLLPYHLGRLTTYAGLGAAGAALGALLGSLPWFSRMSGILLVMAAALFALLAMRRLVPLPAPPAGWIARLGRRVAALDRTRWQGGLMLGLLLGFLPCGLLYAALAVASAGPHVWSGALAMLCFGLGTVPSLVVVGILGHVAGARWRAATRTLGPAIMLMSAVALAGIGWSRLVG